MAIPFNPLDLLNMLVVNYVDTRVIVTLDNLAPDTAPIVGTNEGFKFRLRVQNTQSTVGGMRLKGLRCFLQVGSIARLIVPPATLGTARSTNDPTAAALPVGSEQSQFYLFLPDSNSGLDVNTTKLISDNFRGIAKLTPGTTKIQCSVFAEPDLDSLFPKNQGSFKGELELKVQ